MLALIPVRDGVLPAGSDEAIGECDGQAWFAGSGLDELDLAGIARSATLIDLGEFEVGRWSQVLGEALAMHQGAEIVVVPNCPDGRDLAPRLSAEMGWPLYAGATLIADDEVRLARRGGLELHHHRVAAPFIATLQPGIRGALAYIDPPVVEVLDVANLAGMVRGGLDCGVVEVLPPDVRTMDLTEARRIVGGGAGLDTEARFGLLEDFAGRIGGVMGATRVITDRGWVHHDRQIGTTGVVVDPELYIAFGVSGAVQHTSGLGDPDHIISVNTDPHCPMMAMADLAIVSDANETLDALLEMLGEQLPEGTTVSP